MPGGTRHPSEMQNRVCFVCLWLEGPLQALDVGTTDLQAQTTLLDCPPDKRQSELNLELPPNPTLRMRGAPSVRLECWLCPCGDLGHVFSLLFPHSSVTDYSADLIDLWGLGEILGKKA